MGASAPASREHLDELLIAVSDEVGGTRDQSKPQHCPCRRKSEPPLLAVPPRAACRATRRAAWLTRSPAKAPGTPALALVCFRAWPDRRRRQRGGAAPPTSGAWLRIRRPGAPPGVATRKGSTKRRRSP